MAINARELKAWADLFGIPGKAYDETDAEFKARILRSVRKEPRVCIREEYFEFGRGGKLWVYHYNDGTIENVILRGA